MCVNTNSPVLGSFLNWARLFTQDGRIGSGTIVVINVGATGRHVRVAVLGSVLVLRREDG